MEYNEKQLAILDVAEKIISEKGFESTSIREISKEAKINLAMVSYYFGSKEKLLEALFINKSKRLNLETHNLLKNNTKSEYETMLFLADVYVTKIFNNLNFHKIINKEMDYLSSSVAFEQIITMREQNNKIIDEILKRGIEKKEINPNATLEMVSTIIKGSISHYSTNEKYYRRIWDLNPKLSFAHQTKERIKAQVMFTLKAILKNE